MSEEDLRTKALELAIHFHDKVEYDREDIDGQWYELKETAYEFMDFIKKGNQ